MRGKTRRVKNGQGNPAAASASSPAATHRDDAGLNDAGLSDVPPFSGIFQSVLVGVSTVAMVLLFFLARESLESLAIEDGPLENLTALLYGVATVAFLVAVRRRSAGVVWLLILAAASLFVAGEEISWGQRIFGWSTPAGMAEINVQDETTIHNIEGIHGNIRALAVLFVAAFCVLLPLTNRYLSPLRAAYRRLAIPIFPVSALPWVAMAIGFMLVPRLVAEHVGSLDEIGETALGVAFAMFGWVYAVKPRMREAPPSIGSAADPSRFSQAS